MLAVDPPTLTLSVTVSEAPVSVHALSSRRLLWRVTVTLSAALLHELGAEDEDTAEIATTLLAMDGVAVALLFRESPERRIKVSLRSKGGIDVHRLAGEFGGGGHRNASGIVVEGRLDQVVHTVNQRATSLLSSGSS